MLHKCLDKVARVLDKPLYVDCNGKVVELDGYSREKWETLEKTANNNYSSKMYYYFYFYFFKSSFLGPFQRRTSSTLFNEATKSCNESYVAYAARCIDGHTTIYKKKK